MDTHDDLAAAAAARGVQVLTAISMVAENLVRVRELRAYRQADRDSSLARAHRARHLAEHAAARAVYGMTTDPAWTRKAGVVDAARAWRAAHDWASRDPEAALAQWRAETVLRRHSPVAMARYDTLRAQGVDPPTAMRDAAPLFIATPLATPALSAAGVGHAEAGAERAQAGRDKAATDVAATPANEVTLAAHSPAGQEDAADRAAGKLSPTIAGRAYRATPHAGRWERAKPSPTPFRPPNSPATRRAAR